MNEWQQPTRRFWHFAPWAILLVLLPLAPAQQEDEESRPRAKDRQISIIVTTLLQRQHLNKQKLDDEISRRTFATLLERFDPRRLYLLKEDVDTLRENELTIDDDLRKTDLSFLYKAYNQFAEQVTARLPIIDRWIDTDHDYSVVEA